jgi:hypothetical protein
VFVVQFVSDLVLQAPIGVRLESLMVNRSLKSLQSPTIGGALRIGGYRLHRRRCTMANLATRSTAGPHCPTFCHQ